MENTCTWLYRKKYPIELSDVDFNKTLKLSALFNYFQDISSEHAERLGVGIDALAREVQAAWVLIRLRVDVARYPAWNEEVWIETWPQKPGKIDFERDYIVRDSQGKVIASAVSTWVIVDLETRRIRKTDLSAFNYQPNRAARAIDCKLKKLKPLTQKEAVYKKVIGYSDIDFNGHINNSKYIDYAVDCFSLENHINYHVRSIKVNYINEALPGETISLYKDVSALNENVISIEGVNEEKGKTIIRIQVAIEARPEP